MSTTRRTARRSARLLGALSATAVLALGLAGDALARDTGAFSASAACDDGKGVVTVADKDPSGAPALVSVRLDDDGAGERLVGERETKRSREEAEPAPVDACAAEPSAPASAAPAGSPRDGVRPAKAAGDSRLAETGADSRTGLIIGIAAVLVAVGAGAVFLGLRRRGADRDR